MNTIHETSLMISDNLIIHEVVLRVPVFSFAFFVVF